MTARIENNSRASQIVLELKRLKDSEGNPYYAAFPTPDTAWLNITLKLHECVFMIFTKEEDNETLIIKQFDEKKKTG